VSADPSRISEAAQDRALRALFIAYQEVHRVAALMARDLAVLAAAGHGESEGLEQYQIMQRRAFALESIDIMGEDVRDLATSEESDWEVDPA